ncbi:hypothetical protein ACFP1Z_00315 [Streptomyces gamaensis]|uniref:Uncharacterized protein n=1 Tax=Streptomyces gamaensis TaxID=1763542 RepID=A0ABW0YUZ1_9ACTN
MLQLKRLAQLGVTAVAATALIGGLSANAEAATGTLFFTTNSGAQGQLHDPVDGVCYFFDNDPAVSALNNTNETAFFFTDTFCNTLGRVVPSGAADSFPPQGSVAFFGVGAQSPGQVQAHTRA